jgi:hypothetical protein
LKLSSCQNDKNYICNIYFYVQSSILLFFQNEKLKWQSKKEMLTRIYYWFEGTSLNLFYWLNVMSKIQTIIELFTSI